MPEKTDRRRKLERIGRARQKRRGWTPFPGPQLQAYKAARKVDVLGYGGAGGGGKTDLDLAIAYLQHRRTVIYRRTVPQLAGIVERAQTIYRNRGKYNETTKVWRLRRRCDHAGRPVRPVDVFIQFGSVHRLEDRENWRGIPFDARIFDEAQNFLRDQVLFMMAWTRTDAPDQHCCDILTFNPPTEVGGLWIIAYFAPWLDKTHADPAKPGEVRWFITLADGKESEVPGPRDWTAEDFARPAPIVIDGREFIPRSRTFFPALATDNPALMATGYMAVLDALPEPLRSQMRDGDFTAGFKDGADQLIKTEWVRAAIERRKKTPRPTRPDGTVIPWQAVGVDVAAGGDDLNSFARRVGDWYGDLVTIPGEETPTGKATAMGLIECLDGAQTVEINLDAIGVGKGLESVLEQHEIPYNAINVAESSYATDRSGMLKFKNKRAEVYWRMREALDPESGRKLCLPDDPEMLADLVAPRWSLTSSGITIEEKKKTKAEKGVGMHKGESVMLANYEEEKAEFGKLPARNQATPKPTASGLHPTWGR